MKDTKQLLRILAIANFILYFGFNIWQAVFNNFAVEELGVRADQIGLIQSVREIPGLLGFVLGFLTLWLSEMRVLGLSVLLVGVGLTATGWSSGLSTLMLGTLIMSVGFHFFYPSNASVVLMETGKQEAPKVLGRLGSIAALAAAISTVLVWIFVGGVQIGPLTVSGWGYRTFLLISGGVVILGSLVTLPYSQRTAGYLQSRKVIFRREYSLYYILTFLMGSRRHIFTTFAIFLLVQVHGIDVRQTATLFLVNNLITIYTSAQLGKVVSRFGERKVLTVNFLGLVVVFLGYAYISSLPILFLLFILDNIFYSFSLAVDSYFQKITHSPEEITSNISMAQTINHVSALVVPVLGGILWEQVAPAATFLAGVAIAVIALLLVQFIRTEPLPAPAPLGLD